MMIPPQFYPKCSPDEVNLKCYYQSFCPALATALSGADFKPARFGCKDGFNVACTNALLDADPSELMDLDKLV